MPYRLPSGLLPMTVLNSKDCGLIALVWSFLTLDRLPKRYGIATVGVNNVFDEEFDYFDSDSENPLLQPGRLVFGKVTLALP